MPEKTTGNVLGAADYKVGGGYWLRVPVVGRHTSNGNCPEGQGILLDVEADVDPTSLDAAIKRTEWSSSLKPPEAEYEHLI